MKESQYRKKENELIVEVLSAMEPKIVKSLQNTPFQEQEDLKQEIYLKIVRAIKTKKIQPLTLWEFKNNFDKR